MINLICQLMLGGFIWKVFELENPKVRYAIAIIAMGSLGDVQPYIALGKGLKEAGYRVRLVTHENFAPVYIDLFSHTQHALITGKTGSGKSVLLWRFMLDALSQEIPVVGMDIPAADGESSFKTAIALLGDAGAYFDLSRASNNLMEPPDLRHFDLVPLRGSQKTYLILSAFAPF
jgi:Glycosyltransferase family 28 N-terminal domain/FtsK/SpoIIIE family